jgi:hypothetical protein
LHYFENCKVVISRDVIFDERPSHLHTSEWIGEALQDDTEETAIKTPFTYQRK